MCHISTWLSKSSFVGTMLGKGHDKFKEAELTPLPASKVRPPLIKECVSSLEYKVMASHVCGDKTLFVGEAVAAHIDNSMLTNETVDVQKAQAISYKGGLYCSHPS